MSFLKQLFCKHEWSWRGWSYVRCKKCDKSDYNPELNWELQKHIWERYNDDPILKEQTANLLRDKGRYL